MLFVQTGNARPKCVGQLPLRFAASVAIKWLRRLDASWWTPVLKATAADRWWLVECANAETGRGLIAKALHPDAMPQPFDSHTDGRIVAQGDRP